MECPVCFGDLEKTIQALTPCKHRFCLRCLVKWKERSCPLCRVDLKEFFPEEGERERPDLPDMVRLVRLTSQVIGELESRGGVTRVVTPLRVETEDRPE